MTLAEGFIVLDCIGLACAVRVFVAWVRLQGWNPLKWRGVALHAVDCTFCLPFWCSLPVMLFLGQSPFHAFGVAALGYAFFDTFLPDSLPSPTFHVEQKEKDAEWQARDVLPESMKYTAPKLRTVQWGASTTSPFIDDDARREFEMSHE